MREGMSRMLSLIRSHHDLVLYLSFPAVSSSSGLSNHTTRSSQKATLFLQPCSFHLFYTQTSWKSWPQSQSLLLSPSVDSAAQPPTTVAALAGVIGPHILELAHTWQCPHSIWWSPRSTTHPAAETWDSLASSPLCLSPMTHWRNHSKCVLPTSFLTYIAWFISSFLTTVYPGIFKLISTIPLLFPHSHPTSISSPHSSQNTL